MNLRWLVLFAEIANEGSFTRTASRLNTAQPWLSAQLRKLERELGVKLLERAPSGVQLTPEGRELLPYARQVAEASRQFRDIARTMCDVQGRVVRIGCELPMLDVSTLRRINDDFTRHYPDFLLRADTGAAVPDLIAELRLGRLHFVATLSPIPEDGEGLDSLCLGQARPYLLVPRRSPLAAMGTVELDLSGQQIAAPPTSAHPELYQRLLGPLRSAGAIIRAVPEVDKRAMEHLVRTHEIAVLMIEGRAEDYAHDEVLKAVALPDIGTEHVLVRCTGQGLGKAAERYWTTASTIVAPAVA